MLLLLEGEEEREEGREGNIDVREQHRLVGSCEHLDQLLPARAQIGD